MKKNLTYLFEAAECLKVLANPKRLEILTLLRENDSLSVGDIAESCELLPHVTSEHLRLMLRCGFLSYQKDGRLTFYSVNEPHLFQILDCIESRFKK